MAGDTIERIVGIVNGTNGQHLSLDGAREPRFCRGAVLRAGAAGYAEADPTADEGLTRLQDRYPASRDFSLRAGSERFLP